MGTGKDVKSGGEAREERSLKEGRGREIERKKGEYQGSGEDPDAVSFEVTKGYYKNSGAGK